MAFGNQGNKNSISEINVTPLVDVMLVLLVIFMVTAPMMFSGIPMRLPKTKKVSNLNLNKKQVVLSITASEEIYIGSDKFLFSEVVNEVKSRFTNYETQTLFIRGDANLRYGVLAKMMAYLKKEGISQIALVTEIDDK